jgi:hypothetical protein
MFRLPKFKLKAIFSVRARNRSYASFHRQLRIPNGKFRWAFERELRPPNCGDFREICSILSDLRQYRSDSVNWQQIYEISLSLGCIVGPINSVSTSKRTFMTLELFAIRQISFICTKTLFWSIFLCAFTFGEWSTMCERSLNDCWQLETKISWTAAAMWVSRWSELMSAINWKLWFISDEICFCFSLGIESDFD